MASSSTAHLPTISVCMAAAVLVACSAVGLIDAGPARAVTGCESSEVQIPSADDGVYSDSPRDVDDDGLTDLVVGVPLAAGGGAVDIRFAAAGRNGDTSREQVGAAAPRIPQRVGESYFSGVASASGDQFGAATSFADVNGDYCDDLAIGAPGAGSGRGRVLVAFGSPTGMASAGAVTISGRSAGERFGSSVAAVGADLWIGAPGRTVSGRAGAGAVDHYRVTGNTAHLVETYTQGQAGIAGSPETNDHFGAVLAVTSDDTVAIGIPDESIGAAQGAGMVSVVTTHTAAHTLVRSATVSQNSATITGTAEAGDHFGAALSATPGGSTGVSSRIAVGVPDEGIGTAAHAGMVQVVEVSTNGTARQQTAISQDTATVSGVPETGDRFGAAVQFGGFNGARSGFFDLAVGSPGESLGTASSAGTVTVLHIATTATQLGHAYYEGSPGVGGTYAAYDRFGAALGALPFPHVRDVDGDFGLEGGDALAISAPGRADGPTRLGAGEIDVTIPDACATTCTPTGHTMAVRDSGGSVAGERYGTPVSGQGAGAVQGD